MSGFIEQRGEERSGEETCLTQKTYRQTTMPSLAKGFKKSLEKVKNEIEKGLKIDLDGDGSIGKKQKQKQSFDHIYSTPQQHSNVVHREQGGRRTGYPSNVPQPVFPTQQQALPNPSAPAMPDPMTAAPGSSVTANAPRQLMSVTLPGNIVPGQQIQIRSPSGALFMITVPQGCQPGQTITVNLPTTAPPTQNGSLGGVPSVSSSTEFTSWYQFRPRRYLPVGLGQHRLNPTAQNQGRLTIPCSGRKKCLLIGINYYGTRAELRGCLNDISRIRYFLLSQGFSDTPETMVVLADAKNGSIEGRRVDGMPTRETIIKGLQWLVEGTQPGDALFFQFSGHGAQQKDRTGSEKDGLNETICPVDFKQSGMINDDELWDMLVWPLQSGVKLTALMDCCHSGTGLDLPFTYKQKSQKAFHNLGNRPQPNGGPMSAVKWKQEPNPSLSQGDVVLFSGCADDETSLDSAAYQKNPYSNTVQKVAAGAMTTAFLAAWEALSSHPSGFPPTYFQFLQAIYQQLKNSTTGLGRPIPLFSAGGHQQRPQLSSSQLFDVQQRRVDFAGDTGIMLNKHETMGRIVRHHFKPKINFGGSGLGELLLAGATGAVLADAGVDIVGDIMSAFF